MSTVLTLEQKSAYNSLVFIKFLTLKNKMNVISLHVSLHLLKSLHSNVCWPGKCYNCCQQSFVIWLKILWHEDELCSRQLILARIQLYKCVQVCYSTISQPVMGYNSLMSAIIRFYGKMLTWKWTYSDISAGTSFLNVYTFLVFKHESVCKGLTALCQQKLNWFEYVQIKNMKPAGNGFVNVYVGFSCHDALWTHLR